MLPLVIQHTHTYTKFYFYLYTYLHRSTTRVLFYSEDKWILLMRLCEEVDEFQDNVEFGEKDCYSNILSR